ncbi:SGNH/GDSL hydrolase family protein [Streptomyces sp. ADI95-17]|uniref:SGNH/GDSL hydrolase family protein n=1 Tax=Streptomyces sp. ADI95-17 TaxID=1522759 RepID=UPI000F5BCC5A|nr:SGNH/GDSL hydrolase family protein [Streptomyces sp. ADI95-17]RPK66172.1 GDSL-like Lipase/Acylhydrolase [Streptomyces sp. ADI95-17]
MHTEGTHEEGTHEEGTHGEGTHFEETDTLLFIGDSITDAGRDRTDSASLGSGYVNEIARTLHERTNGGPGPAVINRGVNGNRVYDLEARWTTDVIAHRPTVVTVKIGINDTWRRYDSGLASPVDEFEACLDGLLADTARELSARLVVITPFLLPVTAEQEGWFEDLTPRTDAVLRAAKANGARLVRADLAMRQARERYEAAELARDGVHPSPVGHRIIADAWLAAVGSAAVDPLPRG